MSGPLSPVEQSKETRVITEDLLKASNDKFLRALEAQNRSLEELHQKADEVDQNVRQLSGKVGGAAVTPGGQNLKKAKSHENIHKKNLSPPTGLWRSWQRHRRRQLRRQPVRRRRLPGRAGEPGVRRGGMQRDDRCLRGGSEPRQER